MSSLLLAAAAVAAPAAADIRPFASAECQSRGCFSTAADSTGRTYVSDATLRRVYVYSPEGVLVRTITGASGAGRFGNPVQVFVDAHDKLYVADSSGPIQVYAADGSFISAIDNVGGSSGIAVGPTGDIYAIHAAGVNVSMLGASGNLMSYWPWVGGAESLNGVAYSPSDQRVYVGDNNTRRVVKLSNVFEPLGEWGQFGTEPGDFENPITGLAADAAGAVYVGDSGRIQKFTSDGTYLSAVSGLGATSLFVRGSRLYTARGFDAVVIDLDRPDAKISADRQSVVGAAVRLSASGSTMPFGTIDAYAWDLDGDGTYERSTGSASSVETSFATAGSHVVGLKVTAAGGGSSTASMTVDVIPQPDPEVPTNPEVPTLPGTPPVPGTPAPIPPAGRVGVSINDGALYTNDPNVTLRIVWPQGARAALAANDGGFRAAQSFPLTETVSWTLASSGPERLPKTIYLRYDISGSQTYTDDIILDETAPKISAASFAPGATPRAAAKSRSFKVRLKASDRTSGVASAQFAAKRSRPFKSTRYRRTLVVTGRTKPKLVRVQDRAGNWSSWRRLR